MNEASTGTGEGPDLEEEQRVRRRGLVAALMSGDHQQVRKWLATPLGFCCLGVACEVAMAGGLEMWKVQRADGAGRSTVARFFYTPAADTGGGSERVLPHVVKEWFGFSHENPHLEVPEHLLIKYGDRTTGDFKQLKLSKLGRSLFEAAELNDDVQMTLQDIGECFQYTFLREDWEAEHAETAS